MVSLKLTPLRGRLALRYAAARGGLVSRKGRGDGWVGGMSCNPRVSSLHQGRAGQGYLDTRRLCMQAPDSLELLSVL